jgi:hypothetical protein
MTRNLAKMAIRKRAEQSAFGRVLAREEAEAEHWLFELKLVQPQPGLKKALPWPR